MSPSAMAGAVLACIHRVWWGRLVYRCEGSGDFRGLHWSAGALHWTLAPLGVLPAPRPLAVNVPQRPLGQGVLL